MSVAGWGQHEGGRWKTIINGTIGAGWKTIIIGTIGTGWKTIINGTIGAGGGGGEAEFNVFE